MEHNKPAYNSYTSLIKVNRHWSILTPIHIIILKKRLRLYKIMSVYSSAWRHCPLVYIL